MTRLQATAAALQKHQQWLLSTPARRRAVLLAATTGAAAAILAGGGIVAASRRARQRRKRAARPSFDGSGQPSEVPAERQRKGGSPREVSKQDGKRSAKKKKGGLDSVLTLASVLAAGMGDRGTRSVLALAGMAVVRTALTNRLAKVQGYLFRAAFLKRVPLFVRLILENLALCFAQSLILSSSTYIRGSLGLLWRKILTDRVHSDYFQNMVYYKMSHVDGRVSNPEQRIASDMPRFCSELAELTQENIVSACDAVFYTYRLCSYTHPKYALGILAYVLGAGAITGAVSPPFGKLAAEEQQQEGEYRNLHSRLKTHSESIAFYRGQDREANLLRSKFNTLLRHISRVIHTQWRFGMIQDFFLKYCGATWAVVLIIGPFFGGALRPDNSLTGRADMLSNMRYHTSVVIALFQAMGGLASSSRRLSRLSGYADRIRELMSVARELRNGGAASSIGGAAANGAFVEADCIEFEGVTVVTPTGSTLVQDLTLRVDPGCNLLITGPNGSGKSSLFRVLGGLWPLVAGRIAKPGLTAGLSHDIFYVPQRPYTALGTLQDQLIYPLTARDLAEPLARDKMREMLAAVDLESLLDRYAPEAEVNWGEELSLGEQQRLGMARLFYHSPAFAILDECTSAVTTDMEERFCTRVRAMGTTCVTISHRPALAAFHDVVLALDGEGGWTVHHKSGGSPGHATLTIEDAEDKDADPGEGVDDDNLPVRASSTPTERKQDANINIQHFLAADTAKSKSVEEELETYAGPVIRHSPPPDPLHPVPVVAKLHAEEKSLSQRIKRLVAILVPKVLDREGRQLISLALLVVVRTWLSDRIANLNGASVKNVVQQDRAAFNRLIVVSVLQSSASAVIAPTLRHLQFSMSLGWRRRLTEHLSSLYFKHNAYYKAAQLTESFKDADQRMSVDVDKLCRDAAGLVTNLIKPTVDILWFTWRMQSLTGQRGVAILYAYMLLGLGFLRAITPDFGALTSEEQRLEGAFRFIHSRLRTHAESVAFFGGGMREQAVVSSHFEAVLAHAKVLLRKRWLFGIADEFISKQLPHNVTWLLSLLYALDHPEGAAPTVQGQLAHDLRFLASVVSQSFLAFGDLLELYRKFLEITGGITRVAELDELLTAAQQPGDSDSGATQGGTSREYAEGAQLVRSMSQELKGDEIAFRDVDVVTPTQKLLARKLTATVRPGQSLLVTGPNGSGKSSLFRVLGGLWPLADGSIAKPGSGPICATAFGGNRPDSREAFVGLTRDIFYVPQRPYCALGTLRDQIIYPLSREDAVAKLELESGGEIRAADVHAGSGPPDASLAALDRRLRSILEDVRLVYLLDREGSWDAAANWEDMLSLGEQQRLGMARLFFHRPKFGILDECTNATSVDVEEGFYKRAQRLGISVVTISQRPALVSYHQLELRLVDGEGSWELRTIRPRTQEH